MGVTTRDELIDGLRSMGTIGRKLEIIEESLPEGRLPSLEKIRQDLEGQVPDATLMKIEVAITKGVPEPEVANTAIQKDVEDHFRKVKQTIMDLERQVRSLRAENTNLKNALEVLRSDGPPANPPTRRKRTKKVEPSVS